LVSRARYTSPMPPLPNRAVITCEPRCVPIVKAMISRGDYRTRRVSGCITAKPKCRRYSRGTGSTHPPAYLMAIATATGGLTPHDTARFFPVRISTAQFFLGLFFRVSEQVGLAGISLLRVTDFCVPRAQQTAERLRRCATV